MGRRVSVVCADRFMCIWLEFGIHYVVNDQKNGDIGRGMNMF